MEKVLVAGAGGKLGAEILGELKGGGRGVRALVRDERRFRVGAAAPLADEVFAADARSAASLEGVCEGVGVVISAMGASLRLGRTKGGAGYREVDYGANMNLLAEALKAGVRKFVYVSMLKVDGLKGVAYFDAHEAFVRELESCGADFAVVRPTGFFYVFSEIFRMAERGRVAVVGRGDARTNPVHEGDVARACVEALGAGAREVSLGGPRVYTRREIAGLAFEVLGKPPKITNVPAGLVRALLRPVKLLDRRLYDFLEFGVAVSTVDVVAPPAGARSLEDYFRRLAGRGARARRD